MGPLCCSAIAGAQTVACGLVARAAARRPKSRSSQHRAMASPATECRYYEAKYPEVDDVVMVEVRGRRGAAAAPGVSTSERRLEPAEFTQPRRTTGPAGSAGGRLCVLRRAAILLFAEGVRSRRARVQVTKIAEMGAYVRLLEYAGIEGMILLSELSRRRIRSINKLIKARRASVRCTAARGRRAAQRGAAGSGGSGDAPAQASEPRRARAGGAARARHGAACGQGQGLHRPLQEVRSQSGGARGLVGPIVRRADWCPGRPAPARRRVNAEDASKGEEKFTKSKMVNSIMRHVAETTGNNLEVSRPCRPAPEALR